MTTARHIKGEQKRAKTRLRAEQALSIEEFTPLLPLPRGLATYRIHTCHQPFSALVTRSVSTLASISNYPLRSCIKRVT
ncbi:Protein of unknown function [Pyronema omphalodes CBS 100304]|uniref:Uncharacterized protein n=1 Tax=Pyronema omphalodes (strain CBS 100304) TaxID=1076935 RepID=U4KXE5_PYROM|nr:Protein of unknown function [Pyronema omphalodes CBS 100304]